MDVAVVCVYVACMCLSSSAQKQNSRSLGCALHVKEDDRPAPQTKAARATT